MEDTGLSDDLAGGDGLLTFRYFDSAVDAVKRVRRDHKVHAQAARRIAERFFDARIVLPVMLASCGL